MHIRLGYWSAEMDLFFEQKPHKTFLCNNRESLWKHGSFHGMLLLKMGDQYQWNEY